jgi:hypothetical protein
MKGGLILLVFFILFTSASLIIPSPMFPGNFFCALIGETTREYAEYLSAFFNGVFYGVILWLFFTVISRRLEEQSGSK